MSLRDYSMDNRLALYLDCNVKRRILVSENLKFLDLQPCIVPTIKAAREILKEYHPHIALIHMNIAGKDIFKFCSFFRTSFSDGILIVLMNRSKISIERQLFDCGVSDVVVGEEAISDILMKRLQVHLREMKPLWSVTGKVRLGDNVVDFDRREVCRDGIVRQLPGILYDLLKYFVDNSDHIISREELLRSHIWADSICTPAKEGGKTFDVNMSKLRKIIEPDSSKPQIIKSIRGVGWKLAIQAIRYKEKKPKL